MRDRLAPPTLMRAWRNWHPQPIWSRLARNRRGGSNPPARTNYILAQSARWLPVIQPSALGSANRQHCSLPVRNLPSLVAKIKFT
jgi:hypothetical protein